MQKSFFGSMLLLACFYATRIHADVQYTVTDLGTLGGTASYGYGINASGHVVGWSETTGYASGHAFMYDGTMHDLGTLGGTLSDARGINADGKIVGWSHTPGDNTGPAFLFDGTMHGLATLGGIQGAGLGINSVGQVVGSSTTGASQNHAFLYDGAMHDLGHLGAAFFSEARGINDGGQVVGNSYITGGDAYHAFLWNPTLPNAATGTMHDLKTLGGPLSQANGINSSGQVVGQSDTTGSFTGHAFLWTPTTPNGPVGMMHDLGTLGGESRATAR